MAEYLFSPSLHMSRTPKMTSRTKIRSLLQAFIEALCDSPNSADPTGWRIILSMVCGIEERSRQVCHEVTQRRVRIDNCGWLEQRVMHAVVHLIEIGMYISKSPLKSSHFLPGPKSTASFVKSPQSILLQPCNSLFFIRGTLLHDA